MGETRNICRSCGKVMQPGQICTDCTVTDLKLTETVAESWAQRSTQQNQLPFEAYLTEELEQKKIAIPGPKCKIGRDPTNQVVVREDQYTSRFHAWITCEDGHFFIEDLGSTNGTLLNGSPLINRRPLVNGDQVRIGRTEYTFHFDAAGLTGRSARQSRAVQ